MNEDFHDHVTTKATNVGLTLSDTDVTKILKDLLSILDSSMQHGSGRDDAKQLSWPVAGTAEARLIIFMQLANKMEKEIPDIDDVFVRLKFNKAFSKSIPALLKKIWFILRNLKH